MVQERFLLPERDSLIFLVASARAAHVLSETAVSFLSQPFSILAVTVSSSLTRVKQIEKGQLARLATNRLEEFTTVLLTTEQLIVFRRSLRCRARPIRRGRDGLEYRFSGLGREP